jgi:formate dehydrogenase
MIERGDWTVSDIARDAYDLENKVVGTIGAGRIGYRVLQRLKPFDCKELLYYDYTPLPEAAAKAVDARRVEDLKEFVSQCDVVTVNCPLHEGTRGLVNTELLKCFKKGAWLVNTARGAICDKDAVAAALKSGQLSGYSGDVWNMQPAPKDHVWRTMKNPLGAGNGMVPHYSGTTLDAQARYASGARSILENYLDGKPQEPQNIIVGLGKYESKACKHWSFAAGCLTLTRHHRRPALNMFFYYMMLNFLLNVVLYLSVPKNAIGSNLSDFCGSSPLHAKLNSLKATAYKDN